MLTQHLVLRYTTHIEKGFHMAIKGKELNQTIMRIADNAGVEPIEVIKQALYEAKSVAGAATRLGVNRDTIRYWLNKHKLKFEVEQIVHIVPKD